MRCSKCYEPLDAAERLLERIFAANPILCSNCRRGVETPITVNGDSLEDYLEKNDESM